MMRPLFSDIFFTVSIALILGLLQPSLARPVAPSSSHIRKLKEAVLPPPNWIDLGPAPPTQPIWLRIALPQARFPELERQLYEISNPKNARYGQHLLKEQVAELVRPDRLSMEAVDTWLAEYGLTEGDRVRRSVAGDWVTILVPVATAEEMLNTEFHLWKSSLDGEDGDVIVRTTHYSLPEHLHKHIELVQPTTYFGRPKPMSTNSFILGILGINLTISTSSPIPPPSNTTPWSPTDPYLGTNCNDIITPSCLKGLYNATGYVPTQMAKNSIAVTGYLGQYANEEDLQELYEILLPQAANYTFDTETVNGGLDDQTQQDAGPEANLDTQYAFALAYPTPGTFYSTGGSPPFTPDAKTLSDSNEPYDDWLKYMLALRDGDVPQTISTSYSDDEQTVPNSYAVRVCKEFALLGSRGVSIIFSSGDGGVGDGNSNPATDQCLSNDGTNKTIFLPQFPASCPFVTTVGGTQGVPEVAAPYSGGGFSNYFARPAYQQTVVQNYLNNVGSQYKGMYNPAGRAYPDVSAQSNNFAIILQGQPVLIGGTSAAAPAFAGIVALLNDASIAEGKPPLGFLNPMLYSIGIAGLNDITQGNAPGCGTQGFSATTGWDPVTGLGTPNFGKLKSILSNYNPSLPSLLGSLVGALLNLKISLFVSLKLL